MGQDIVADGLNHIMNAKRVEKTSLVISRYSKVLVNLLTMMKEKGHLDFEIDEKNRCILVSLIKLNVCKAVKPRYYTDVDGITRYLRRFLPSRRFGSLILSTNKGLIDHTQAMSENIGGSILAYFY